MAEQEEEYNTASSDSGSSDHFQPAQSHIPPSSLTIAGQCQGESSTDNISDADLFGAESRTDNVCDGQLFGGESRTISIADGQLFGAGSPVDSPSGPPASSFSSLGGSPSLGESFVIIPFSDSSDTDSNCVGGNVGGEKELQGSVKRKKKAPPVAPKPRQSQNMDSIEGKGLGMKDESSKREGRADENTNKEGKDGTDKGSPGNDKNSQGSEADNKTGPGDVKNDSADPEDNNKDEKGDTGGYVDAIGGPRDNKDEEERSGDNNDEEKRSGDNNDEEKRSGDNKGDNAGQGDNKGDNAGQGDAIDDDPGQGDAIDDAGQGDAMDDAGQGDAIDYDPGQGDAMDEKGSLNSKDEKVDPQNIEDNSSDYDIKGFSSDQRNGDVDIDNQDFRENQEDVTDDADKHDNDDEKMIEDSQDDLIDGNDVSDENLKKDTNDDSEGNVTKPLEEGIDADEEGHLKEESVPEDDSSQLGGVDTGSYREQDHLMSTDGDEKQMENDANSANNLMENLSQEILQDLPTVSDDTHGDTVSSFGQPMQPTDPPQSEETKLDTDLHELNEGRLNPPPGVGNLHEDSVHSNVPNQPISNESFVRENMAKEVRCRSAGGSQEHQQMDTLPPQAQENEHQPFAQNHSLKPQYGGHHPDTGDHLISSNEGFNGRQGGPQSMPSHANPVPTVGIGYQQGMLPPQGNVGRHQHQQQQQHPQQQQQTQDQDIPQPNTWEQQQQYQLFQRGFKQHLPEQHWQYNKQIPPQHHFQQPYGQHPYPHQPEQQYYNQQASNQYYHGQQYAGQWEQHHHGHAQYQQQHPHPSYQHHGQPYYQQQHQEHHGHQQYQHHQQQTQQQQQQQQEPQQEERGPLKTVRVEGLTEDVTKDALELYFESKRSKGGEISSAKLDLKKGMAFIEFVDAEAAERVLTKKTHLVNGQKVQVALHDETRQLRSSNTIKITGMPQSVDVETIELYFENRRRSDGGEIEDTRKSGNAVYITFKEPGVAEQVAAKTEHRLKGVKLTVRLDDSDGQGNDKKTLVVTNYQPGSSETVTLHFENKNRYGGGEHEMKEENGKIYLTFQSEEVVERVLKHCPHKVDGKTLTVTRLDEETEESELDEKPRTTIKVTGYKKGCTNDSISLYFENKRKSGGGEIVGEIRRHAKKDIIYIEFQEEEVARRVVSKTHTLSGCHLTVELVEPQVMYKNKFLISGVPELESSESLQNYLEGRSGQDVSQILFGEEPGEVVVSFGDNAESFDFAEFEKQLGKKVFKHGGKNWPLRVSPVPQTSSITVPNLPPDSTEDQIRLYFENQRRSGGGDVIDVIHNPDEQYAVVTFKEVKAAEAVSQRDHNINKVMVKANLCLECLGEKGGSLEPPVTRLPEPKKMEGIDKNILRYLTSNDYGSEVMNKELGKVKAKPDVDADKGAITFHPSFDLSSPDAKSLIKTWTQKVEESWRDVVSDLALSAIQGNPEIWAELKSSLKPVGEKLELFTEDANHALVVVGPKKQVSDTARSVEKLRSTIQARCDKRKTMVTDNMKIQPPQLMLMIKQGIMNRFITEELKFNINGENGEINFTGQEGDITKAKTEILEEALKIKSETVVSYFTSGELEFLRREHVDKFLQKQVDERATSVAGCWEKGSEGLKVYFYTDKGLEDVKRFLKGAVKETIHRLDEENFPLLESPKYTKMINQLTQDYDHRLTVQSDVRNQQIVITTVSSEVNDVAKQITDFLKMNSIYSELVKGDKMKIKFVIIHCQDKLERVKTNLKEFLVSYVTSTSPEYTIRFKSTEDGCPLARRQLLQVVKEVKCHKRDLERPGLKEFLKSEKVFDEIESDIRCVIGFDEGNHSEDEDIDDEPDFNHSIPFECQFDYDRKLHIVVGEMTSLASDVEAVVVEVTPHLSCDSRQAWEVMQNAGDRPASELRRFGQNVMEGEVFCTNSGDLRCQKIIHAVGPCSRGDQKFVIVAVVVESLQEAVKKNLRTVALPSFFTASVTSPENALRGVVEGVHTFYNQNRNSNITDVYLCLETWEHCENLWGIAMDVFGAENVKSNDEMSTSDSLHGGNRRGMGLRKVSIACLLNIHLNEESMRDLKHYANPEQEIQNFPEGHKNLPRPRILLVEADMGVEEADVIVNSTGTSLDLSQGQVSKSLLKNAGPAIQAECSEKYPKGIKMGDIAVTSGGNMQCVKVIYHCTLPQWKDETGKKTFTDVMNALLKKAHDEKMETMAIPALGTGNLGYSRELVAKLMYETVTEFCKKTPETTINDVLFIVYHKDLKTIEAFEVEHKQYQESIGGSVNASKSERTEELDAYRTKQGYIQKFGGVVSKVSEKAKSMWNQKKKVPIPKKPPVQKPPPPVPTFNRQGAMRASRNMIKLRKVSLCFYTDDEHYVSQAMNKIFDRWDRQSLKKEIQDETIKKWTDKQIKELEELENKHTVSIEVVKSQGLIKLFGLKMNVANAHSDILYIIRNIEKEQKEKEYADDVQRLVQWSFEEINDDGEESIRPYPSDINLKLERAYSRDQKKSFTYQGYVFDFEKWLEYPEDNPEDAVKMIRKDKVKAANENLPDTWDDMPSHKDMEIKVVNMNSSEFSTVKANFTNALGSAPGQIVRVDRIQSKTLFQQYQAKKDQLSRQNPGVTVEQTLWHGTNKDAAISIAKSGFNRSYCDKKQNAYGEGAYFTSDAGYAGRSKYAPTDAQGKRLMFQSKVLTGNYTKGQPQMRVPPPKDEKNKQNLYDSVVDDPANPTIFVIFSDTQAYPEYLITFT